MVVYEYRPRSILRLLVLKKKKKEQNKKTTLYKETNATISGIMKV